MDFRNEYQAMFSQVTASEGTRERVLNMAKGRKKRRTGAILRKVLLAAALIGLLAVTANAASEGGFLRWFSLKNQGQPLTDSQVTYIEENTQQSIAATPQASGDYCIAVKSAITDGRTAYITLGLTAPEDQALNASYFGFTEALLIPDKAQGLAIAPDGSSPDALCDFEPVEDGDGLPNTQDLVFTINPQLTDAGVKPFDGHIQWTMRLKGLTGSWFNGTTYEDVPLSEDTWEFTLTFRPIQNQEVKLLSQPKTMLASPLLADDYHIEVTVTALNLSSLSFSLEFTPTDSAYREELLDIGDIQIVMKDGSVRTLLRVTPVKNSPISVPIVLEDVDYVRLSDGTRLPMPG